MALITWDGAGERLFEYGLDRGVLYPPGEVGVPWNGLVSVDAGADDAEVTPMYYNGIRTFDLVYPGEFSGKIKAITYPDKFLQFEGSAEQARGVFVSGQPARTFGLSYRTLIGNDSVGNGFGYKIHVLYNLTAIPQNVSNETLGESISPIEFEWEISGIPEWLSGKRPTVHFTFDSTKMNPAGLAEIEKVLYGSALTNPHLPSVTELLSSFTITITDNGDGTWTAEGPDHLFSYPSGTTFEITDANAVFIDASNYVISST